MRTHFLSFLLVLTAAATGAHGADAGWLTDYQQALTASQKSGKAILADFTGSDWCGWCIKLKKEVFDTEQFKTWAAKNVVLLELDFPRKKEQSEDEKKQNQELAQSHGIEGFPTVLFLDHTGKKLGETGYIAGGPAAWIATAEPTIAGYKPKSR